MNRTMRVVATGLLGGALVPLLGAGTSAAAAGAWAPTATGAVTPGLVAGLTDTGDAVPAGTPLSVTLSLPLRDAAAVRASIAAGRVLTPATFDATYGPTQASVDAVAAYLTSEGFTNLRVSTDHLLVTADGTAGAAEAAFATSLHAVTLGGHSYVANVTPAAVPAALAGTVTAVLGLTDVPTVHVSSAPASTCFLPNPATADGLGCALEPTDYQTTYDAKGTPDGSKTPIAIFGEGVLTQVATDLAQERSDLGLPPLAFNVIQPAADSAKQTDTSAADEFDIDTQSSTGMANDVSRLDVYDATSLASAPITADFDAFTEPDPAGVLAKAGSASFGGCESLLYAVGEVTADDPLFMKAAAQGQTVFASSGDTGSSCRGAANGVPAGVPGVEYPASAEYVVGVGGTSLLPNKTDFSYGKEIAWAGGGCGYSTFEPQPSWQATETSPYGTVGAAIGKSVPDVANVADPNLGGMWVDVAGTYGGYGGTSLASPVTLGEWARVESAYGDTLGFASPLLYKLAGTPGLHDVTQGNTGACQAASGYDLATGLGTLDVAQVDKQLTAQGLGTLVAGGATPGSALPESPLAVGLPLAALGAAGLVARRRRRS